MAEGNRTSELLQSDRGDEFLLDEQDELDGLDDSSEELSLAGSDDSILQEEIDDDDGLELGFVDESDDFLQTLDAIIPEDEMDSEIDEVEDSVRDRYSTIKTTADELIYVTASSDKNNETVSSVNMSLSDLERTAIVDASEEEDNDPDGMVTVLEAKGYVVPDSMSYKDLKILTKREEGMMKESPVEWFSNVIQSVTTRLSLLAHANATMTGSSNFTDRALAIFQSMCLNELSDIPQLESTILSQYSEYRRSTMTVDTQQHVIQRIFKSLSAHYQHRSCAAFFDKEELVKSVLMLVIPQLERLYEELGEEQETDEEYRMQVAESLLPHLIATRSTLAQAIRDNQCYYVRQLFASDGELTCVCAKCGEQLKVLPSFIDVDLFMSERDSSEIDIVTPIPIKCECGAVHTLAPMDYKVVSNFYHDILKGDSRNVIAFSKNFASGSSTIHYRPAFQQFKDAIRYLVLEENISVTEDEILLVDTSKIIEEKQDSPSTCSVYVNDKEFEIAVRTFYDSLIGLPAYSEGSSSIYRGCKEEIEEDEEDDDWEESDFDFDEGEGETDPSSHLSLKEVALIVASRCSLNYRDTKNAALFSLISTVKESIPLDLAFSMDKTAMYSALSIYLERVTNGVTPSEEEFNRLLLLYAMIAPKEKLSGLSIDTMTKTEKEEILQYLKKHANEFTEKTEIAEERRRQVVLQMAKFRSLLAYVKIVRIAFVSTYDLLSFIADRQIRELMDEITDNMIITNYGDAFYDSWIVENLVSKSKLNAALRKNARVASLSGTIVESLKKITGIKDESYIASYFDKLSFLSAKRLEPLHAVSAAYRECKYYSFLRAVTKLPEQPPSCLDQTAQSQYIQFVQAMREIAALSESYKEAEFYLADFDQEEIDQCKEVEDLTFGRFVPYRLNGESLPDWIKRYKQLQSEDKLGVFNSFDYATVFAKFDAFAIFLTYCTSIFEMEFASYTESVFIVGFAQFCMDTLDRELALELLGSSEVSLALMKRNSYEIIHGKDRHELLADYLRMLQGFYVTEAENLVTRRSESFDKLKTYATEDLSDVDAICDLKDLVASIEREPNDMFIESVEDEFDDQIRASAINEIKMYLGERAAGLIKQEG